MKETTLALLVTAYAPWNTAPTGGVTMQKAGPVTAVVRMVTSQSNNEEGRALATTDDTGKTALLAIVGATGETLRLHPGLPMIMMVSANESGRRAIVVLPFCSNATADQTAQPALRLT